MNRVWGAVPAFLIGLVLLSGCGDDDDKDSSILASEEWQISIDQGEGSGVWTFTLLEDSTVEASGSWITTWNTSSMSSPFANGTVTFAGSSLTMAASGTATSAAAPQGYQSSPFTVTVTGSTLEGTGSGTYTIHFTQTGWPATVTGQWEGTRSDGEGVMP